MRNFKTTAYTDFYVGDYDHLNHFVEQKGHFPFVTTFNDHDWEDNSLMAEKLYRKLELEAKLIHKHERYRKGEAMSFTFEFPDGTLVAVEGTYLTDSKNLPEVEDDFVTKGKVRVVRMLHVFHAEEKLPEKINELIFQSFTVFKKRPSISLVARSQSGFYLKFMELDASEISTDLDLYYGDGFSEFHRLFLNRLSKTSKGIALLHGDPGTGKTCYIKRLLVDLLERIDKRIILVPTNLVAYLIEPEFNSFLLEEVRDDDQEEGKGTILVIEDAEAVLQRREGGMNSQSTSNILNLTDGLLNDVFDMQVIATYNSADDIIDPAILREKRLMAKRNFGKLGVEEAKKLATHIGAHSKNVKAPMSIAEIYAMLEREENEILIGKTKPENRIGF